MSKQYRIDTLNDILKIPLERRPVFLKDLELLLSVYEFAIGDVKNNYRPIDGIVWTDDGTELCVLTDAASGEMILSVGVTKE